LRHSGGQKPSDANKVGAAQCAEFIIGPAKGRTRWLIAPYGCNRNLRMDQVVAMQRLDVAYVASGLPFGHLHDSISGEPWEDTCQLESSGNG
jgi:hypothetical protein